MSVNRPIRGHFEGDQVYFTPTHERTRSKIKGISEDVTQIRTGLREKTHFQYKKQLSGWDKFCENVRAKLGLGKAGVKIKVEDSGKTTEVFLNMKNFQSVMGKPDNVDKIQEIRTHDFSVEVNTTKAHDIFFSIFREDV